MLKARKMRDGPPAKLAVWRARRPARDALMTPLSPLSRPALGPGGMGRGGLTPPRFSRITSDDGMNEYFHPFSGLAFRCPALLDRAVVCGTSREDRLRGASKIIKLRASPSSFCLSHHHWPAERALRSDPLNHARHAPHGPRDGMVHFRREGCIRSAGTPALPTSGTGKDRRLHDSQRFVYIVSSRIVPLIYARSPSSVDPSVFSPAAVARERMSRPVRRDASRSGGVSPGSD